MPTKTGKKTREERREENRDGFRKASEDVRREHLGPDVELRRQKYSRELEDKVFDFIAKGKTLKFACRMVELDPASVFEWNQTMPEVALRYALARRTQAETWADSLVEEADTAQDGVNVQSAKLRINTKQWLMGKYHVAKFGDKVTIAGDTANPLAIISREMSPEEAAATWSAELKKEKG